MSFTLHPRLAADTQFVADWPLCRVLLMEDARYFWIVLVPRLSTPSGLRWPEGQLRPPPPSGALPRGGGGPLEFVDLTPGERAALMEEGARAGRLIKAAGAAKLNFGALGNLVPQLHLHVVGRSPGDAAWPGPVWGQGEAVPYEAATRNQRLELVRSG